MNIEEEINKLITEYFSKHNEVLMNGKDAMLRDNYAQLDAIELVCDIANVYNQCVFNQLEEVLKTPIEKIGMVSAHKSGLTPQDIDRLADAVYWDSCHIRRD
jgi:hypothetical protein